MDDWGSRFDEEFGSVIRAAIDLEPLEDDPTALFRVSENVDEAALSDQELPYDGGEDWVNSNSANTLVSALFAHLDAEANDTASFSALTTAAPASNVP